MSKSNQYVGLDVSLKETSIAAIDEADKIVWRGRVELHAGGHCCGAEETRAACRKDRPRGRATGVLAISRPQGERTCR